MKWNPASPGWVLQGRVRVSVQDGSQRPLYSKLKVTFYHFCHILWVSSNLQSPAHIQGGRRISEGHKYHGRGLGLALETAYYGMGILFSQTHHSILKNAQALFTTYPAFSITLLWLQWDMHLCLCKISAKWCYRNSRVFTSERKLIW